MGDADRGLVLLDVLSAMTAGEENVNLQIIWVYFNASCLFNLRAHLGERERGVSGVGRSYGDGRTSRCTPRSAFRYP